MVDFAQVPRDGAVLASVSYHDLFVTTANIPRTPIGRLPYDLMLTCTRAGGWELWRPGPAGSRNSDELLAAEFADIEKWLVLDVGGVVILDSRR